MTILQKIKISGRYGKGLYIVTAIMTFAASGLVSFAPNFHPFQHKRFKELSGGEARVVEMFLVLNTDCEFCILDELFSNIAPIYVEKMQELIKDNKLVTVLTCGFLSHSSMAII